MKVHRLFRALIVSAVATCSLGSPASAGAPVIERVTVDEQFFDEFLSQQCGVEVITHIAGTIIFRDDPDDRAGVLRHITFNTLVTASADGNTVQWREVALYTLRRTPDGTLVFSRSGQVLLDFSGNVKLDAVTREVIHESQQSRVADRTEEVCARLTGS